MNVDRTPSPRSGRATLGSKANQRTEIRVYLAGKISKNCWRHQHVAGLRWAMSAGDEKSNNHGVDDHAGWPPEMKDAIAPGVHYVGPFFMSDDHGCAHADAVHACGGWYDYNGGHGGVRAQAEGEYDNRGIGGICGEAYPFMNASLVVQECLYAIKSADVVVALPADDAHGTFVEIGYALALGKRVITARQEECETCSESVADKERPPWWFAEGVADINACCAKYALDQVKAVVAGWREEANESSRCESPIERSFLAEIRKHPDLARFKPNVAVLGGRYRIDFADTNTLTGVELDGHAYHSDKDTFTRDRQRQRELERAGWRLVRYSGSEVHRDVEAVVADFRSWLDATAQAS